MDNSKSPFGDITQMLQQFKVPGVDFGALVDARRKDIEALAQANRQAFEGMQAIAKRQAEILQQTMSEWQQAAQNMAGKDLSANAAQQTEMAKAAFEKAIAHMREMVTSGGGSKAWNSARTSLAEERALAARQARLEREGRLVPADLINDFLLRFHRALRDRVLGIGVRIAPRLVHAKTAPMMQAIATGSSRLVATARSTEHQVSRMPTAMIGSGRRPLLSGSQNARNMPAAVQRAALERLTASPRRGITSRLITHQQASAISSVGRRIHTLAVDTCAHSASRS